MYGVNVGKCSIHGAYGNMKKHTYIYIYVCFNWDRARWKPSGIHVQVGITAMFLIFRWNYLLFVCSSILSVAEVMGKVTR